MATIAGSQFVATVPGQPVNVAFDNGGPLPPTVPGAFNLEVFLGSDATAPTIAPGYQGLAVLSPSGFELDLISGAFAVTDNGTGGDILGAAGMNETISGGGAPVTLILSGTNDVADGGAGNDYIQVSGSSNTVNPGSGNDAITIASNNDTVIAGSGSDTISVFGDANAITGSGGPSVLTVVGTNDTVVGGSGNAVISVTGDGAMVTGGSAPDTINVFGNNGAITGGSGPDTINVFGAGDSVTAGSGNDSIGVFGSTSFTFVDRANIYADTVVGFDQAAGDRIHLTGTDTVATTTLVNGGTDTLITLSDNSTILLKGITHVDNSFFS
jgi:Ca2+-binding RTX toxin-like protein